MTAKEWVKFYNELKAERGNWETRWNEVAEYCAPTYADMNSTFAEGQEKTNRQKQCDPIGIKCVNLLAKTIHSMVCPPGVKWVDFVEDDLKNPSLESKEWIQSQGNKVQWNFDISNFHKEFSTFAKILVWQGTPVMFFENTFNEQLGRKVFQFTTLHPKEGFIGEMRNGRVIKFIRLYKLPVGRILQDWPDMPTEIKEELTTELSKSPTSEREILNCVYEKKNEKSKFPIISKDILLHKNAFLSEEDTGYYTFPYITLRWESIPGEKYGNSPALDAIGHIKSLNQAAAIALDNYDKSLNPPTMVTKGSMESGLNISSGAINLIDDVNDIKVLIDQGRWDVAESLIRRMSSQTEQMFFIDQIQLPPMEGTPHTAFEIQKRIEFQMRILGPMFGSHNFEFLDPLIERSIDLLLRDDQFDPIPDQIQDGGFKPKYIGPLSKAQKISEASSLQEYLTVYFSIISNAPQVVQTNPELSVMHNWKKIFDIMADARSVPLTIFNDEKRITEETEKLKQMQQAQAEAEMAKQGASAYKDIQSGAQMERGQ